MYCVNCGAQLVAEMKFCGSCGAPADQSAVQTGQPVLREEQDQAPQPEKMKQCLNCGAQIVDTADQCDRCGAVQISPNPFIPGAMPPLLAASPIPLTYEQIHPDAPRLASILRRGVALLIDGSLIVGLSVLIEELLSGSSAGLLELIVAFGYFLVLEQVTGQTLGKLLLGIHVTDEQGNSISWAQSAIRNVLRIIDYLPFIPIVGPVLMWTSDRNQRLGDRTAKTLVVHKR